MALVLDSRFTKDQILELYLNDVVLGQRGPFEIHGVARGRAHLLRQGRQQRDAWRGGDDRRPDPVAVAALAVPQSRARAGTPQRRAAARWPRPGSSRAEQANKAASEPLNVTTRALENEAPYFVDYVSQLVEEKYAGLLQAATRRRRLHDARPAAAAHGAGGGRRRRRAGRQAARRTKKQGQPQVALIAVDPRTGEILALVGGRAYNAVAVQPRGHDAPPARARSSSRSSTSRRSSRWRRRAARDLTPATVIVDEPTIFQGRREGLRARQLPGRVRRADDACGVRSRSRATSSRSRSPRRPATTASRTLWKTRRRRHARPAVSVDRARRVRGVAARDGDGLHALHERRPGPAAAGDHAHRATARRAMPIDAVTLRPIARPETTYPRDQHDAQRHQRRHGRRRAQRRLHARRRRQDRHDERSARRLVRRLHARAAHRRLGRASTTTSRSD